jgi:hypothetical protein
MKKLITYLAAAAVMTTSQSCTDVDGATKALEHAGYKPIEVGGYDWFNGSENDFYRTKFKAVALNGDTITGGVSSGLLKGSTIRLDD